MSYHYINLTLGIPVYNSSRYLEDLFLSLQRQTARPREVLFIDDLSHDNSADQILNFIDNHPDWNIRLVRNRTNLGISRNYNKLISESTSEWIQILDADDYLIGEYYLNLESSLGAADAGILITGYRTRIKIVDFLNDLFSFAVPSILPTWLPVLGTIASRSGAIYKKELLDRYKFPNIFFDGFDILHLLRIRSRSRALFIKKARIFYRLHSGGASNRADKNIYYSILRRKLKDICILYLIDHFIRKAVSGMFRKGVQ